MHKIRRPIKRRPVGWRTMYRVADEAGESHMAWGRKRLEAEFRKRGIELTIPRKLKIHSWSEGQNFAELLTDLHFTENQAIMLMHEVRRDLIPRRTQGALRGNVLENAFRSADNMDLTEWKKKDWFRPAPEG